jgi:ABC-type ATPase involved in cell division
MYHVAGRLSVQIDSQALAVRGLTHFYGSEPAVEDVSFDVAAGKIAALLGPSGCGKSTVLRAIAGLLRVKPGVISLGGNDPSPLPGRSRGIGMVFQNYALFPHMTVAENIGYPLTCHGWPRERRRARVAELVATVQLQGLERRLPRHLSGGQQRRVAVARALAVAVVLRISTGETLRLPRRLSFVAGSSVVVTAWPEGLTIVDRPSDVTLSANLLVSTPLGPNVIHSHCAPIVSTNVSRITRLCSRQAEPRQNLLGKYITGGQSDADFVAGTRFAKRLSSCFLPASRAADAR